MLTFEEWRHTYADVFETDDAARAAWTAASNKGYRAGVQDTRELLAAHSDGAQGELPSCDVERMRAAFESARPAVKKFHYQWDARRQRYLLDGDEDRGQYMQNEFAEWCEAWRAAIASHPQPMSQTDASRHLSNLLERIHRDGGHYEAQHGIAKAVADADDKVAKLNAQTDAARDVMDHETALRGCRILSNIVSAYDAGNQGGRVIHLIGVAKSWLAEIERIDRAKGE